MRPTHSQLLKLRFTRLFESLGILWILLQASSVLAAPIPLWQIGDDEDPYASGYNATDEFSQESGSSNAPPGLVTRIPGDPLYLSGSNPARDDHFYQAGIYPSGFNGLTTPLDVPYPEPTSAFERALSNSDPSNFIHFRLTSNQANSQSRLRLTFELMGGSVPNDENFGTHDITVRFRTANSNMLILQRQGIDRDTRFTIDIPAFSVQAVAGANTIEITRAGPAVAPGNGSWIQFDFVKMEVDTDALADGDNDGLPRWWENDNHLSDSNPNDANVDQDGDTLTALQEYNGGIRMSDPHNQDTDADRASDSLERSAGSNPNLPDTDNDGLTDADEILIAPTSSPLLVDSDGDTAPDAWEKRVGSNPNSAASVPSSFAGAIGFNFVSRQSPSGRVEWLTPAGIVPQLYWNNTIPLRDYNRNSGNTSDIGSPSLGAVTRSDGQVVPSLTVNWTSEDPSTTNNTGSADQKLMNGFLRASDSQAASLTISNIPFSNYHVFAYVGGGYDGQEVSVTLNNEPATNRVCYTYTAPPRGEWVEIKPATPAVPIPFANVARYASRTDNSLTIHTRIRNGYWAGLHAIQIIDATLDADGSGIPDWYEMQYAMQPASPATANADPDGDSLTNLQEFQRGSNPRNSDTDGDSLTDSSESAANALSIDSDGDGLGDYAETTGPLPSNPNLADSDNDGISDKREAQLGTDPNLNPPASLVPTYTASPTQWEWKLENVQLVWDHSAGAVGGNDGYDQTLLAFYTGNQSVDSRRSIDMRLRYVNGALTYQFESFANEAFSNSNQPTSNIYLIDNNNPPVDLKAALGFSGYGKVDISDQLRFQMLATRGAGNVWAVTFEIFNLTRNTSAISRLVSQSTAAAGLEAGTANWQDRERTPDFSTLEARTGTRLFITPTLLETSSAFSAHADTDNDGMPNVWEDIYQFNKTTAADATQDADGDGLNNREEYLANTHPRLADTDGDGVDDRIERLEGSNPLLNSIRPAFANGVGSSGTDFNQNGLPDAWEARFKTLGIPASGDADGDGASNATEAAWGTDPFDADSQIELVMNRDGNDALLAWTRSQWKRQRIYRSGNLSSWQWLSTPFSTQGENNTARLSNQFTSAPRAFFSVETKDRDSDGDGVADWDEVSIDSDPYQRDSTRSSSLTLDPEGNVGGSVSGDYANFAGRMKNALLGGPGGQVTREQAARFLQQASFGPTFSDIEQLQILGFAGWIDDQIANKPLTLQRPVIEAMIQDVRGPRLDLTYNYNNLDIGGINGPTAFARGAIAGQDQLRQRVAFALSQILVASRRDPNLSDRPAAMADFYDIFIRHAFGNYRDVLQEVSLHPVMGRYLSHIGNQKARPEINQFPDENYARELMQLFTIGLWELNPDGSRKLDNTGKIIPTYDNGDITEMARIFTGFWFGGQTWNNAGNYDNQLTIPMSMWAEKHDFGAKSLLGGLSIPARPASVTNGLRDVDDALDFLFEHPNTGPFVGRQLIQFLVTGNPSPTYISRVAAIFANNGSGKRGDLAAVTRSILLDPEARDVTWSHGSATFGRLKEPVHRAMNLARAGRLARYPAVSWWDYGDFYDSALQSPGYSPSVFNFYRPDYRAPGLLTENQLAGPAFQITNSYSSISFVNRLWRNTVGGIGLYDIYNFTPDYQDLLEVAGTPSLLLDRANLLFCGGMMSAATRATILNALSQTPASDPLMRVQLTVFIAAACPEGAVQR